VTESLAAAPPTGHILALDAIEARFEAFDGDFARSHARQIEAHWRSLSARKPALFNGRVLLQHQGAADGRVFRAAYGAVDYAAFLAWRDFGHPTGGVRNGFSMAALQAADGAFLLGVMGEHTANAGMIYFAAGTPDLDDVTDAGIVDLAGSVIRELVEETGLQPHEIEVGEGWTAIIDPVRVAFMRPVSVAWSAQEARSIMLARMAREAVPELADIIIVRTLADLVPERMPRFMQDYLRYRLAPRD
jgi:8-oxo-dGTP pyrophosphatase MutT (NUDIX family)